jgi:hypothetical protein
MISNNIETPQNHLRIFRSHNSTKLRRKLKRKPHCVSNRLCRRVACEHCQYVRQRVFIDSAVEKLSPEVANSHVTLTTNAKSRYEMWNALEKLGREISRITSSKKIKPRIRCLAIGGTKESPHAHLVLPSRYTDAFIKKMRRRFKLRVHQSEVQNLEGILEYIYKKNYLPTACASDVPKRMRLLTASQGIKCSLASKKKIVQKHKGVLP